MLDQSYRRRNRPGAGGALRVYGRGVGLHHNYDIKYRMGRDTAGDEEEQGPQVV